MAAPPLFPYWPSAAMGSIFAAASSAFAVKVLSLRQVRPGRVRGRGPASTGSVQSVKDLIENAQVQAIIRGPQILTEADHVARLCRRNHIPVLSFSGNFPTLCTFWLEHPVTASRGHATIGLALGSDTITFHNAKAGRRIGRKLHTIKSRKDCRGETVLKIAVPDKKGFYVFVNAIDPISKKLNITGYSIDVFEAAMRNLNPRPCYEFVLFEGTYDELVGNVSSGVYDGAVGDVTITVERVTRTDFTMPYTQSGVSMLVLAQDEPETIRWTFVKPLSGSLWFATAVFLFYTGFVVWMIELPRNQEYQGSSLRQCSTALYFVFSTLTFSHGESIRSPLSKIVVVVWCFAVLILVQSYTASLSSILTAKRLRPSVTDLNQLRNSGDFVGYQHDSFVRSLLMKHNISERRLKNYTNKEEYADALRKGSKNGGVSAIVDEIPYLTSFLSDPRYNNDFRMVGCIYRTPGFGFAFRLGSPLVHNLSIAILRLAGEDVAGSKIEAKWFGTTSPPMGAGTLTDTDSAALTLQNFSGLFIITGSISTLMLLISILRLVRAKCTGLRRANMESVSYSDAEHDSHPLQNGMGDNPSPDHQPLREARNGDSQGVHGSGQNAGDLEPGPVQQNCMHTGSVPAKHIQIETIIL
ncbi:glutamate receptor 2.8 isoform X2 [Brachypodium distachyon]|uniref:Ionotropic glutamate receptor C-terminal domain-containing protein n=1 Tax=Brachypodium distachyon TaxID=15368 RepID=A0A0Q3NNS4_BRADI|nr:glutamate receptor 2.8 isoform X2 [Brachypodium distachyon]KQK19198.1 hypothetical protein BRADI_1g46920v3 [Brachypodium distachyon]|eukprot:XP_014756315.1 glutamate receptor 2.8 isoform X2 [Brachypodium distachyon]